MLDWECDDTEGAAYDKDAVANGGAAMVAYALLQGGTLTDAERRRLHSQLLRYCELDTLAMVMAWEALEQLVE